MAWLLTYDEKSTGFSLSDPSAYADAPSYLNQTYRLAEGMFNRAQGILSSDGFSKDYDVYSLGFLYKGTYNFSTSNSYWLFGQLYWPHTPQITIFNSSGVAVSIGSGFHSYNVITPGEYYVRVEGSSFQTSLYEVYYSWSKPLNIPNNSALQLLGTPQVGNTLVIGGNISDQNGTASSLTNSVTYGWYVDSVHVASTSTYTIKASDAGKLVYGGVAFYDDAGYLEVAGAITIVPVTDSIPPKIAINSSDLNLQVGDSATITFTLSEVSTNFTAADVTVAGGTLSNFSGSGTHYTALFTPTPNSTEPGIVSVASGTFTDTVGNSNDDGAEPNNTVVMIVNTLIVDAHPFVVTFAPVNGAVRVPVGSNIVVTYSEPIRPGSGLITLRKDTGEFVEVFELPGNGVSIQDETLLIEPSFLLQRYTRYTLQFEATAIEDLAGNDHISPAGYSFLTETLDELYHFFVVAFSGAPGKTYMAQMAEAYNNGLAVRDIVNVFTTKPQFTELYPESLSHRALAVGLVNDVVKNSASEQAKASAVDDITLALDLGLTRGDVIYTVFGNLASLPFDHPVWGGTAKQFDNQLKVASWLTEEMAYASTDVQLLRAFIANVTPSTDLSTPDLIIQLIGQALL